MHEIYELKDKLMKELEEYGSKKELNAGSLQVVDTLSHTIKNLCKIIEAAEEEEYSQRGGGGQGDGGRYSYNYSRRNSYEGGNMGGGNRGGGGGREGGSYARNRQRRDSTGRYSGEYGYSRTDSVEEMVQNVREMMQDLPEELQRDAQRFVQKLEQQM